MDPIRFEALIRSIAGTPSRRHALHLLAGSLLGGLAPMLGLTGVDAHDLRRKPGGSPASGEEVPQEGQGAQPHAHRSRVPPSCTPRCGTKVCGADGCGGSCGACFGDCGGASCSCPTGTAVRFAPHRLWGSQGNGNGQFDGPWGIAAAPNGGDTSPTGSTTASSASTRRERSWGNGAAWAPATVNSALLPGRCRRSRRNGLCCR